MLATSVDCSLEAVLRRMSPHEFKWCRAQRADPLQPVLLEHQTALAHVNSPLDRLGESVAFVFHTLLTR